VKKDNWLSGWRLNLIRIAVLIGVLAITAFIFSIRDQSEQLQGYGYPGIFVLSILSNATLILPAPGIALTFAFGAVFNPVGVALAAGASSAIGELTGYLAGFSGQGVIEQTPIYDRLEGWTERYGGWTIMVLALIPNPLFDVAGAAAGALKMPVLEFLFWAFIGKTMKMLLFAIAGAKSMDWLLTLLGG
jgi:membrane protein YqaA with SNARE-associated domain